MKLQNYKEGEIHRIGDKYQYVEGGEVKGTYDSVEKLVKATEKKPKKQDESKDAETLE